MPENNCGNTRKGISGNLYFTFPGIRLHIKGGEQALRDGGSVAVFSLDAVACGRLRKSAKVCYSLR